jgi:hypothetical protein
LYDAKDTLLQPYMSLSPAMLPSRVGGEGEVVVPEQVGGHRSRGRDQGVHRRPSCSRRRPPSSEPPRRCRKRPMRWRWPSSGSEGGSFAAPTMAPSDDDIENDGDEHASGGEL